MLPVTHPRSWVYRDGSPVTWFNWHSSEPNNPAFENNIELGYGSVAANDQWWNDVAGNRNYQRQVICTNLLPAGAQNNCTWLNNFED